ncbi:conserved Plasmodium protein, unknown function [Plasmodium knowlesi strain H]|uniref:TFIIS N-terminal domain-containing protein n=3 Tax=Plasmodium knowlesi TaxID=5850 RepID=A0A5K1VKW5_PLAKH|nr:conserved Plasmodium protein, unknown function [Plasmodium knowlesi strain H]OTN67412.1 Uncharacterized protein PKNOH_S06405000 [Plasmodium knowlesi]CAA9987325.1 conserved Plasmodium protein, unknown function [Plasmodium knowlesi strain H]SBO23395.1 conserved Plasmodium protein, unknown function [Plasmodium knowlesi strain H]SBO24646.1 conserved Plasmodium protein, unknown function [Plasmodium knowlesi strain H]VVS76799.1 conserved Plasmodium protein, unknown function [Plasmodium knowlesi s|eukprot:XP_002258329.1 hypothetical protein, conserved in Plasmodium species [Plasmodium knowlesi strain H]
MELTSNAIHPNEVAFKKPKKNMSIKKAKANSINLDSNETSDMPVEPPPSSPNGNDTDEKDTTIKSKVKKHRLKKVDELQNGVSNNDDGESIEKSMNQKKKEKLTGKKKKDQKESVDGEGQQDEVTNVETAAEKKAKLKEARKIKNDLKEKKNNPINVNIDTLQEQIDSINKQPTKDTKQIILELKSTLNIVDSSNEIKKIDGLNTNEIKTLDAWYSANKLKIIPCLFEDKPLNASLLNALYYIEPAFRNKKRKIIIYLKFVKAKYEKSLKRGSEGKVGNSDEDSNDKKDSCKDGQEQYNDKIMEILHNDLENLKQKEYMKKILELLKNENSFINLKQYFYFLTNTSIDILDVFLEEDGLSCIKHILQNIAKRKRMKKCSILLIHILNVLKKLNITLDHLKCTLIGVPINFIARNKVDEKNDMNYTTDNEQVQNMAKELIDEWKLIRDKALTGVGADRGVYPSGAEKRESKMEKAEERKAQNKVENAQENTLDSTTPPKGEADSGPGLPTKSKTMEVFPRESSNDRAVRKAKSMNPRKDEKTKQEEKKGNPNFVHLEPKGVVIPHSKSNDKKKTDKSNEGKNIMLEIIDTLNEEYEKKKKRHQEYRKAKIEGKIKKFSSLKNTPENVKSEIILPDIDSIPKPHLDSSLSKRHSLDDFSPSTSLPQHHQMINKFPQNNSSVMNNYMQSSSYRMNKSTKMMSASPPPHDRFNRGKENYPLEILKKQNGNAYLEEEEPYNSRNIVSRNSSSLNRTTHSRENKSAYMDQYNGTHDDRSMKSQPFEDNESMFGHSPINNMNTDMSFLKNKRGFPPPRYSRDASRAYEEGYREASTYRMHHKERQPSDRNSTYMEDDQFGNVPQKRRRNASPRNNPDDHLMYDHPYRGKNSGHKTVQFSDENPTVYSYDAPRLDRSRGKEMKNRMSDIHSEVKDPFELYSGVPYHSRDLDQGSMERSAKSEWRNGKIFHGNNTICFKNRDDITTNNVGSQEGEEEDTFWGSFTKNEFMNLLTFKNVSPNGNKSAKGAGGKLLPFLHGASSNGNKINALILLNSVLLEGAGKKMEDRSLMNNREVNLDAYHGGKKYGDSVERTFGSASHMKEMLHTSLKEIFKNYKNFENVKINYEVAIKGNHYPPKIFEDSEVLKNDIIIKFNYDSLEKVPIYLTCGRDAPNIAPNKYEAEMDKNSNNMTNLIPEEFNLLPLPELFPPPNLNNLQLPPIPIIPGLPSSQNIIPPIMVPYNSAPFNELPDSRNNLPHEHTQSDVSGNPIGDEKLYKSFDDFLNIFDEDIRNILLKNTDLAKLLMSKPDVVKKMLKGPEYINEALCSLEEELKSWNRSSN